MRPTPRRLPLRRTAPHPWRPLTEVEWQRLRPWVTTARGRPPADLRRTWDAIFWVACSRLPWHALPSGLGKPDSAHRALRRAARSGQLDRLLLLVSDDPDLGGWEALRWRIARACRRVARLLTLGQLDRVQRLGLHDALPCEPADLPKPALSESIRAQARLLPFLDRIPSLATYLLRLHREAMGNYRAWRTTG